ncbi:DUF6188 family protein [Neotabrizicola sp. sgz301269]|uniref:DUF6188 family protein n=1 Tax=Neotabrizicola sp. sgz301269 TaxID=3276282 RepID=UPI00376F5D52
MKFLKGNEPAVGELNFLLGLPLLQVCMGANEVILNFDGEVSITIEAMISFRDTSGNEVNYSNLRSAASALVTLLPSSVDWLSMEENGTLILHFRAGCTLLIHKDSDMFESYQVRRADEVYVV